MLNSQHISKIQKLFSHADSLIITAGAGMGVDSGLPDFRGNHGMWQAYPALAKQCMQFTSIANPNAFQQQPHLAWGFYGHRLKLYQETIPHQGFHLLKKLSAILQLPYFIFTSNVDGQFQKAGFAENLIYECHGSIQHLQCLNVCTAKIWTTETLNPHIDHIRCEWLGELPHCPHCQALARPNILMFDDYDWIEQRSQQQRQNLNAWLTQHHRPIVIELGAGTAIPTVRYFSERFAPAVIRINPREAQFSATQGISLEYGALEGMQIIFQALNLTE